MTRREALALLGGLAAALGCGPGAVAPPETPKPPPLALDPLVDLAPAAGLVWLFDARAGELLASPVLRPGLALLFPPARFDAFAEHHGGVDLRSVSQLVIAQYDGATLALASTPLQPARVEAAFAARALDVDGRAVEGGVTRLWGTVAGGREQVAVFDARAVGLERGRFGPLRAATYFARGLLKRALPALRAEPLVRVAKLLGDAPLRAFAPGPFEGEWSAGLGGLLRATTAAGASVHPVERPAGGALEVQLVLAGAWGADASRASERLASAFQLLGADPLGRLMGIDHPLEEARVSGDDEALRLQVVLDPLALARGLQAATDARISEIMAY
ncbi:MAG TPA: hypothetical protein VGL81_33350 [Polyangiaceae bacterium]|jgi:hypothetical protein